MNSRQPCIFFILLSLATAAGAGQAYTWTDSEGITHFSESLPADYAHQARPVELPPAPVTPGLPPDRYRSISDQAARMQADRLQREQQRDKRRLIEAKRQQLLRQNDDEDQDDSSSSYFYYPYWYGPYSRRHHPSNHHRRHRQHPPPRPEFQPGKTLLQKRNQEALRDQYYRW
jgi:hypothetical protein